MNSYKEYDKNYKFYILKPKGYKTELINMGDWEDSNILDKQLICHCINTNISIIDDTKTIKHKTRFELLDFED